MSVSLKGQQEWEGFHVLCKPPELGGIDRRLFGICILLFGIFWQGMGTFRVACLAAAAFFFLCRYMTKKDPHFFAVLRLSTRYDAAWCDPGDPPERYGSFVLNERVEELESGAPSSIERLS